MKTPVCEICAVTGSLCSGCQKKLESDKISKADVEAAKALYELREKHALEGVVLIRAIDAGKIVYLLAESEAGRLIGRGGKTAADLTKRMGKHVRVIKTGLEPHKLVEQVLLPAKPAGINTVFHEGRETLKIRIPKREYPKLPAKLDELKKTCSILLAKPVQLVLE